MSETRDDLVTFEVYVGDDFVAHIHLVPESEALVAAFKSNPTIRWVQPQ